MAEYALFLAAIILCVIGALALLRAGVRSYFGG